MKSKKADSHCEFGLRIFTTAFALWIWFENFYNSICNVNLVRAFYNRIYTVNLGWGFLQQHLHCKFGSRIFTTGFTLWIWFEDFLQQDLHCKFGSRIFTTGFTLWIRFEDFLQQNSHCEFGFKIVTTGFTL